MFLPRESKGRSFPQKVTMSENAQPTACAHRLAGTPAAGDSGCRSRGLAVRGPRAKRLTPHDSDVRGSAGLRGLDTSLQPGPGAPQTARLPVSPQGASGRTGVTETPSWPVSL